MIVMKFGGTSLGSVERIRAAAAIVAESRARDPIVVLSAMAGVTNRLIEAGTQAAAGAGDAVQTAIQSLQADHEATVAGLIRTTPERGRLTAALQPVLEEMQNVLTGVLLLRERSPRSGDLISSFGERLVVPILAAYLNQEGIPSEAVDARDLIVTKTEPDFVQVDFRETGKRCRRLADVVRAGRVPVMGGFICSTPEGATTTLGRGGSDYSASVVANCTRADEVQIWTDVDGVMTADPRIVKGARVLEQISYKEAAEMAYFGAKVLHPKTIMPAADLGIPIRIKNTLDAGQAGTLITGESPEGHQGVKNVTSIPGVALVSIEGRGMIGVPGTARRAFGAIADERINVLMFSQGSSEQHISVVVSRDDGPSTIRALRGEFRPEIEKRQIDRVASISDIAIIALVGEGLRAIPGIAARAFGVIGDLGVNILMIAQGTSELNLSMVVEEKDAARVVGRIHDAFQLGAD